MQLKRYKNMLKPEAEEFKVLMFGRKFDEDAISLYEKILQTPSKGEGLQPSDMIQLIWETFELWRKGFVLNLVGCQFNLNYL
jgi:hypothetical protein